MNKELIQNFINTYDKNNNSYKELEKNISIDNLKIEMSNNILNNTNNFIKTYFIENVDHISKIVDEFLSMYFNINFKFLIEITRNTISVKSLISENGTDFHEITTTTSGGVMDFISLLLRIIFLSKTNNEKVLFIDEPFKNVSDGYRENLLEIVKNVVKKFDMQIIAITHSPDFAAISDNIYVINKIPEKMHDYIDNQNIIKILEN